MAEKKIKEIFFQNWHNLKLDILNVAKFARQKFQPALNV